MGVLPEEYVQGLPCRLYGCSRRSNVHAERRTQPTRGGAWRPGTSHRRGTPSTAQPNISSNPRGLLQDRLSVWHSGLPRRFRFQAGRNLAPCLERLRCGRLVLRFIALHFICTESVSLITALTRPLMLDPILSCLSHGVFESRRRDLAAGSG